LALLKLLPVSLKVWMGRVVLACSPLRHKKNAGGGLISLSFGQALRAYGY